MAIALMVPQWVNPSTAGAEVVTPISAKFDFGPVGTAVATGWTRDSGLAYSAAAGRGWIREDSLSATHVPYGYASTVNTRDRTACTIGTGTTNVPTAQQRTFIHMQAPTVNATSDITKGAWEYDVPNGRYQVTLGIGDPSLGSDPEIRTIHVEGVTAFENYPRPAGTSGCLAAGLKTNTVWATVSDGKLTVDALGGTNTKLAFVTVDSVPLNGLSATPGSTSIALNWNAVDGASGYRIWRGNNLPVATTGTPFATTTDPTYTDNNAAKGTRVLLRGRHQLQ